MATSAIRFTGLASGMDTESLVKAMVAPYQAKVDAKLQQQTLLEWKKDAYKEMNTKLYSFFNKYASSSRLTSTFSQKNITSSDTNKVQVESGGVAPEGTHTVNSITKLAEAARVQTSVVALNQTSSVKRTDGGAISDTNTTTLGDLGLTEDLKIRVSDGAQTNIITLSASDKLSDVITDIDGIGNLTISFDTTKSKFDITSTASPKQKIKIEAVDTGQSEMLDKIGLKTTNVNKLTKLSDLGITTDSTVQVSDGSTKATVTLKANMTVGEFQAELAKAMPNASVGFDETAGSFFISSRKTGASQAISMEVKTGSDMPNLLSKLGLATAGQSSLSVQGSDSLFTYNGVTMQTDSNTATVNGMKLTLKATTNTEVDINVTADTEATVKFVNDFVTEYNKLIDDAYTGLKADSASKYKPLTAEQKETMSEDDIKLWEKKIKDSLLRRDAPLTKVVDNMRTSLSGVVEGNAFKNLAAIGITTGDWTQNGKLEISEEKLRAAVNENSEAVIALFAKGGDPKTAYLDANKESTAADYDSLTATEKEKWVQKTTGLGQRLYTGLYDQFKAITDTKTATSIFNDITIQDQIDDAEEDVDTLNDKLSNMEDIYYKRFTAMEKMMSQLNNQSNWLTQQLGGSN